MVLWLQHHFQDMMWAVPVSHPHFVPWGVLSSCCTTSGLLKSQHFKVQQQGNTFLGFLEHKLCSSANSTWNAAITIHVQMLSHWRHPTLLCHQQLHHSCQTITCSQGSHTSIASDCFPCKDDFLMLYKTVFPSRGITSRSFSIHFCTWCPAVVAFIQIVDLLTSTQWLLNKIEKLYLSKKKKKKSVWIQGFTPRNPK